MKQMKSSFFWMPTTIRSHAKHKLLILIHWSGKVDSQWKRYWHSFGEEIKSDTDLHRRETRSMIETRPDLSILLLSSLFDFFLLYHVPCYILLQSQSQVLIVPCKSRLCLLWLCEKGTILLRSGVSSIFFLPSLTSHCVTASSDKKGNERKSRVYCK